MQQAVFSMVDPIWQEPAPRVPSPVLSFRTYTLHPGARMLLDGARPVPIGDRAFDLLHALLATRGQIVGKADLMKRVWPDVYVDECNLRFQIVSLRRALGRDADVIKTVTGRGYLLADEIAPWAAPSDNGWGAVSAYGC